MEVIEKHGVPHAHLKKAIDSRMPTPTLFATYDYLERGVAKVKATTKVPDVVSVRRAPH